MPKSVVLATGGASKIGNQYATSGYFLGDGIAMAARRLSGRCLEFSQFHPPPFIAAGVIFSLPALRSACSKRSGRFCGYAGRYDNLRGELAPRYCRPRY